MSLPAAQYAAMKSVFRMMLSTSLVAAPISNDTELFGFFNQLCTEGIGPVLTSKKQASMAAAWRTVLTSNTVGSSNPSDADVLTFFGQLQTDSAGAGALAAGRYAALKDILRDVLSTNFPGSSNPSTADALSSVGALLYNPNTIAAGLTLWFDGRFPTFSDVGGLTASANPTGRVLRANQPPALTGSWNSTSLALSPFKEFAAADFACGAGQKFACPVGVTLPANNATVGISFVLRDSVGSGQFFCVGFDSVANWGLWTFSGNLYIYREGAFWATSLALPVLTPISIVVRFTAGGAKYSANVGGIASSATDATAISARTVSTLALGDVFAGFPLHGVISQLVAYNTAITDPQTAALLAGLVAANQPAAYPDDATLLTVSGDSIPRGFNIAHPNGFPFICQPNLWATAPIKLVNTAVSGWTIAQMTTDYSTLVAPNYSGLRSKNILLACGGTNSLAFGTAGLYTQFIKDYLAYLDRARADGWKVIACTILPRTDAITNGSFDADRLAYNILLRAAGIHYHALADMALISGMSLSTDSTGANFGADHVHPSIAGHVLMEAVCRAAVLSLLP